MKKMFFILVMLISFSMIFAVDINTLLTEAEKNSASMEYKRSYSDYQHLILENSDLKNGLSLAVDVSGITLAEESKLYPDATLTVILPEYVDDLSVSASLATTHKKSPVDNYYVVPGVAVSKSFTFKDYQDTQEDLAKERNRISTDNYYTSELYSFQSSLLDDVIDIITLKVNIENQVSDLEDLKTDFDTDLEIGNIDIGSISEMDAKKTITKAEIQLESSRRSLETMLKAFKNTYGIDYQDVSSVPDTDLTFVYDEEASLSVRIAKLNLEIARQKLEEKTGTKTEISVGATASSTVDFDKNYKHSSTSFDTGATAKVSIKNLEVQATYGGTITKDEFTPSLSISGKWNNDAKPSEVTKAEILELQNKLIEAQNTYDNALFKYKTTSEALAADIQSWYDDCASQDVDDEYDMIILNKNKMLYENGLITADNLNDAQTTVKIDGIERTVLKLKAMKLKIRIDSINM